MSPSQEHKEKPLSTSFVERLAAVLAGVTSEEPVRVARRAMRICYDHDRLVSLRPVAEDLLEALGITAVVAERDRLAHEHALLAKALGDGCLAAGAIDGTMSLTGPDLLNAAKRLEESLAASRAEVDRRKGRLRDMLLDTTRREVARLVAKLGDPR